MYCRMTPDATVTRISCSELRVTLRIRTAEATLNGSDHAATCSVRVCERGVRATRRGVYESRNDHEIKSAKRPMFP